jgi:hypothetical protein
MAANRHQEDVAFPERRSNPRTGCTHRAIGNLNCGNTDFVKEREFRQLLLLVPLNWHARVFMRRE